MLDSYMTGLRRTTWVINCLDDVCQKSIDYPNRIWLREHAVEQNIRVQPGNCVFDDARILVKEFPLNGRVVIQNGKQVKWVNEFKFEKEALLLIHYDNGDCFVFLYAPSQKQEQGG